MQVFLDLATFVTVLDGLLGAAVRLPEWVFRVADDLFDDFYGFTHISLMVGVRASSACGLSLVRPLLSP